MGEQQASGRAASILLVDDNDGVRAAAAHILEQASYLVTQAPDTATALALMDDRLPDLIITDIFMPGSDGFEMLNEIRHRALTIPVIAISGGGTLAKGSDYLEMAGRLGAAVILEKPLKMQQLLDAVTRALDRIKPPSQPETLMKR